MTTKYHHTFKEADAWITVLLYDRFAVLGLAFLDRLGPRVTPNMITALSLVVSFCAAGFTWFENYLFAALFMQTGCILDCLDGKWARYTKTYHRHGKSFDAAVDLFNHTGLSLFIAAKLYSASSLASASLVLIAFGAAYIHIRAILSVDKSDNTLLSILGNRDWYEACRRHRLIARPISEVEICFFLPSLLLLLHDTFLLSIVGPVFILVYALIRVLSKPV